MIKYLVIFSTVYFWRRWLIDWLIDWLIICRRCRFYNSTSRKRIGETYKAFLNLDLEKKKKKKKTETETSEEGPLEVEKIEEKEEKIETTEKNVRLFHDDTFKGFFRRLSWSNDGKLHFKTKTQEMSSFGLTTIFKQIVQLF